MKVFALVLNAFSAGINLSTSVMFTLLGVQKDFILIGYICFCVSAVLAYKIYGEINEELKKITE